MSTTNNDRIWLSPPHLSGRELAYVEDAFRSNWIAPLGPNVDGFEQEIGRFAGGLHVAALSSGTAALHLALVILGIDRDDIVLCQSLTFAASANPILYQKAIPLFVDSEPTTWNICPDSLETAIRKLIAERKKPKALILVHLYGMPARMKEIKNVCAKYEIPIIEDAAESMGARYGEQQTGALGDIGIFSFNGNKIITTSGGGALLSKSEKVAARARFLATQARDDAPHYEHSRIGYNYRMSNICAGIGRGQLEVLNERVKSRRANYDFYKNALGDVSGISFQNEPDENFFSNRWLTAMTIESPDMTSEAIRKKLANGNIESRPLWKPMHMQPVFKGSRYFGSDIAEKLFRFGLCLPSGSSLTSDDRQRVIDTIFK